MENLLLGFLLGEDQTSLLPLSKREKECLQHIKAGYTAKEIARLMTISHRTVENHVEKIKAKLGCQNQTQIIKLLHESYKKIIERLPGNVYWLDRNCVTLGCNENTLKLIGLTSVKQFIGITYEQMGKLAGWTEGQAESFKRDDMEVMATGIAKYNVEEPPLYDAKSEPVYYMSTRVPLFNGNKEVIGVVGISIDITERKKAEQALIEAKNLAERIPNKIKAEFLENMRHDIRTPLEGIMDFANKIKNEAENPTIKKYANNLIASSNALSKFLNEILETINVTSGRIPLHKNKFDLRKCLTHIIELNHAKAQQKQLNLDLDYASSIATYLIGDAKRIQRIILELVTNALKFTHEGSVKISAQLAKKENRNVVIKIIVADTGIGIPADQQQEIFVRFKRLSASQDSIYSGTGLGLALIKQFIDELNGEIYVESTLNKGTTFTCLLPLKETLLDEEFGAT